MLWTCSNNNWFSKQSFTLKSANPRLSLILKWSSETPYKLLILNRSSQCFYETIWSFAMSSSVNECEDEIVAVIDNSECIMCIKFW